MNKRLAVCLILMLVFFTNCNKKAEIPTYVYVNRFDLSTDYTIEGSASEGITDVWAYLDNVAIGVFELPAKFPIVSDGGGELVLYPGVKKDGISNTRLPYPFYTAHTQNFSPDAATVDTITPSIEYISNAFFPFLEDFETGNSFSGLDVTFDKNVVFEGDASSTVALDNSISQFAAVSRKITLPNSINRMFVEMNYKNDVPFNLNIKANKSTGNPQLEYVLTVNPKSFWNKIYIEITEAVLSNPADDYNLVLSGSLAPGNTSANLYWDNIKIVHFK
jgi:hypothetical protein